VESVRPKEAAVSVIGAGAAGLFAAAELVQAGRRVEIFDHRGEAALKLRLAGSSGLNLTNALPIAEFAQRYGDEADRFRSLLQDFPPDRIIDWAEARGARTFRGSGGKILTKDGDGSALIEGLLRSLRDSGLVSFRFGYRFSGFTPEGPALTGQADSEKVVAGLPALLALGGASWPLTGSDGLWTKAFREAGIRLAPFRPANCGFETALGEGETGERVPVKNLALAYAGKTVRGDIMLTPWGIEGAPVYAHASALIRSLEGRGGDDLIMDLYPDLKAEDILRRLSGDRGKASASTYLKKRLRLSPAQGILLRRALGGEAHKKILENPTLLKALPLPCRKPRPLEEAISVSGGVEFGELNEYFMLNAFPRIYCAGEMLDWDAPTGGFLLTGCFVTAHRAVSRILETE